MTFKLLTNETQFCLSCSYKIGYVSMASLAKVQSQTLYTVYNQIFEIKFCTIIPINFYGHKIVQQINLRIYIIATY